MQSRITFAHVKTAFWLLTFAALVFAAICKMYWPAIVPMFIAFFFFEKNLSRVSAKASNSRVQR